MVLISVVGRSTCVGSISYWRLLCITLALGRRDGAAGVVRGASHDVAWRWRAGEREAQLQRQLLHGKGACQKSAVRILSSRGIHMMHKYIGSMVISFLYTDEHDGMMASLIAACSMHPLFDVCVMYRT